jgi:hypothetical protein
MVIRCWRQTAPACAWRLKTGIPTADNHRDPAISAFRRKRADKGAPKAFLDQAKSARHIFPVKENIGVFFGILLWGTFLYRMITRISYVVDERYLRVVIGKFTLRKIAIADIAFVDTSAPFWNEHWCNTAFALKRVLRVRRKSGWIKNFIITPANRDEMLRALEPRVRPETT